MRLIVFENLEPDMEIHDTIRFVSVRPVWLQAAHLRAIRCEMQRFEPLGLGEQPDPTALTLWLPVGRSHGMWPHS